MDENRSKSEKRRDATKRWKNEGPENRPKTKKGVASDFPPGHFGPTGREKGRGKPPPWGMGGLKEWWTGECTDL